MRSVHRRLQRIYDAQLPPLGLGLFRIAFAAVILAEVGQILHYRHFFFDPVPYRLAPAVDPTPWLALWLCAAGCLLIGWWTRTAAVLNYALTVLVLNALRGFDYHHDYLILGVGLVLAVAPVSCSLSVDRWLERRRRPDPPPARVSAMHYYLLITLGLGLVYFDSTVHKLSSPMWSSGLGLWQPASMPFAGFVDWGWLLDRREIMLALGYATVVFEGAFLLLIWFRWARMPLLLVGVGLHLGILLFFAMPLFALGVLCLYIPVFFLARDPGAAPVAAAPTPPPRAKPLRVWGLTGLLGFAVVSQGLSLLDSPPLRAAGEFFDDRVPGYWRFQRLVRRSTGIGPHAVVMDPRWGGVAHPVLAVTHLGAGGNEAWLPILTEEGRAHPAWTGRNWVYWLHRICVPPIDLARWSSGLERLTAYWGHERGIDLADATFAVRAKLLPPASGWERGRAAALVAEPWVRVGTVRWIAGEFSASFPGLPALGAAASASSRASLPGAFQGSSPAPRREAGR